MHMKSLSKARGLVGPTEPPVQKRRSRSVPGWLVFGVCSVQTWGRAAVGTDLGLTVLATNQQALVTLNGGTGHWHRVEASTNLVDWC